MKKILLILTLFLFFNSPLYADKLLESGFLNNNMSYQKYHDMDMVDCFQYYNQIILNYVSLRSPS